MNIFYHIGRYTIMVGQMFSKPEKFKVYWNRLMEEIVQLGIKSVGIVVLMSVFMGMVLVIQTASSIDSPLIPTYTVGFTSKQSILLEFSPTIIALILAGKVGSNIASELGSMRVTEQIDALEIMGVNSMNFLITPKIIGAVLIFPIVIVCSMAAAFAGGYLACISTGLVTVDTYEYGIQLFHENDLLYLSYALGKTAVFAFIMTSISAYQGYFVKGGALEVGKASTRAVVYSSVLILVFNYIITQLVLID
ncbi:MlaE family ABC transporter permease [Parvicella tangerina]|uniref:Intermembrane phospholipid transport system permease protein MlaE n=1 Tax=Parvicella tangerina TaxID=2829795 RepID=A0A916JNM2_9FLAO|nr:ABC transporter permease [Parvicella tangerina]CAG5084218.1 Intermembrane phospholipid transport system permease protein MlaE [Parvicella tangerina]